MREERLPISVGRVVNWFSDRSSHSREERLPISGGMLVNWLPNSPSNAICPSWQPTFFQLQGILVVNQSSGSLASGLAAEIATNASHSASGISLTLAQLKSSWAWAVDGVKVVHAVAHAKMARVKTATNHTGILRFINVSLGRG